MSCDTRSTTSTSTNTTINTTTTGIWSSWIADTMLKTYNNMDWADAVNDLCCTPYIMNPESKEEKSVLTNMPNTNNTGLFNGIFGKVAPGMCRVSMSGKIAIKTSNGYKTFDWKKGRLTNCDNFAFDIGEDFFFVIPTNKVEPGDIVLVNGKPRCILEVNKNEIKTFCYEDSTISTIVPERHMFMGKQYFYGKIISMFGEMGNTKMMKFMMLKEIMGGNNSNNMLPILAMMGGLGGNNLFDGIFDLEDDANEEENENG